MKLLTSYVVLLILTAGAFAQITLTQSNAPTIGQNSRSYSASAVQFNPSATGGNQTWNVSEYSYSDDGIDADYISPASTPFANDFPTATLATVSGVDPDLSYTFIRVASDGYYLLGIASLVGGENFLLVPDHEVLIISLPATMGSSWSSVNRYTLEIIPGFSTSTVDSTRIEVQAWGTMTTPMWTESCLKGYSHSYNTNYLNGQQQGPTTERWSYNWFTANPSRTVSFDNQAATGPDYTDGDLNYSTDGTSDVPAPRGPVSESFKLSQNYPNPFNPTTTLPIELSKSAKVEVTIYNENGQEVFSQSMDLTAGQHSLPIDGSAWGSGSYFAKVMAGNEVQSTRMVLVK